jgi:hypothetical protein
MVNLSVNSDECNNHSFVHFWTVFGQHGIKKSAKADLTLSPHGEDLKVWFREINSGLGKTRRGKLGPSVINAGKGLGLVRENTLQCAISKIIRTSLVVDGPCQTGKENQAALR